MPTARAPRRVCIHHHLWVVLPVMVAAKRVLPWGITSLTSLEFVAASPCALPRLSSLRCASAALTLPPSSSLPSTQSRPRPTQGPDDAPAPPLVRLVPHASPGRVLCPTALLFLAHLCLSGSSYPCAAPTPIGFSPQPSWSHTSGRLRRPIPQSVARYSLKTDPQLHPPRRRPHRGLHRSQTSRRPSLPRRLRAVGSE